MVEFFTKSTMLGTFGNSGSRIPVALQYAPSSLLANPRSFTLIQAINESGSTLQRWNGNDWVDYKVDGKVVKSPVDIDALPPSRYRLV